MDKFKGIILALLQVAMLCFNINSEHQIESRQYISIQNLKFGNVSGKGVTAQMIKSFSEFADFASFIYREDLQKNTKYIKSRMDELYGLANNYFYIFIQTDQTVTNQYFWVPVDQVYAGLNGISSKYPKWSYLFLRAYGSSKIAQYDYFGKNAIGTGISKQILGVMKQLIFANEADICTCSKESVQAIGKGIYQFNKNSWSVICDDKGATYSLLFTFGKKYVNIRQINCYYTMYLFV